MLRKIITAGVIGASVTATMVATPAQAAAYSCTASHVCLWTASDYNGTRQAISGFADYTDVNSSLHDAASSWGSSTNSQAMCVIDWVNGRQQVIGLLRPGNRTTYVGDSANDRSDAVTQC